MKKLLSFLIVLIFAVACASDPNKASEVLKYEKSSSDSYSVVEISYNSDNKLIRVYQQHYPSKGAALEGAYEYLITYDSDGVAQSAKYVSYDGNGEVKRTETTDDSDILSSFIDGLNKEIEEVKATWTRI